jgi:hypothetical protein
MAIVIADRVKETTTTTGTGSITLAGASTGFQSFAAIGNGNNTYYTITDGTNWEVGLGRYSSTGPTLFRVSVLSSSNSNQLVDWGAGTKTVFVTVPSAAMTLTEPENIAFVSSVSGNLSTSSVDVNPNPNVEYLIVAGGGGGGSHNGGGGGAGGFLTASGISLVASTPYSLTVGAGGAGALANSQGTTGSNSSFNSVTSSGGGGGGGASTSPGLGGGSGGGAAGGASSAGNGTPGQGNNGGASGGSGGGGGGGGAGAVGSSGITANGGNGGAGLASSITGTSVYYSGGGGGTGIAAGAGSLGGGGAGGSGGANVGTAGTANTGGGGGGAGYGNGSLNNTVAAGGSGVVILKYAEAFTITNPGGGLTFSTSTAVPGFKITTFTAGTGNIQFT